MKLIVLDYSYLIQMLQLIVTTYYIQIQKYIKTTMVVVIIDIIQIEKLQMFLLFILNDEVLKS